MGCMGRGQKPMKTEKVNRYHSDMENAFPHKTYFELF